MMDEASALSFWDEEFGGASESRDYCGRIVVRSLYGRAETRYGWTVERISPDGTDLPSDLHIVNCLTARERGGRTQFDCCGRRYAVRKHSTASDVPYDYARKDFRIVRLGAAPDLWTETFGESEVGTDFTGRKVLRALCNARQEGGWNVDHILPRSRGGSDDMSNLQIASVYANTQKGDSCEFSIDGVAYRVVRSTEVPDELWGNSGYDYSQKTHCIVKKL